MYIRVFSLFISALFCSFIFLDKTDGAPRGGGSAGSQMQDPKFQTSEETVESCPKNSECVQALNCPEQARTELHPISCSHHYDGPWVCCILRNQTAEFYRTSSLFSEEPLAESKLEESNSWRYSYDSKGNATEKAGNEMTNTTDVAEDYDDIPAPAEYRRNYDYGTWDSPHRRHRRPHTHYKQPWDSWDYSYSDKWEKGNSWSRPETRNTHGQGKVRYPYDLHSRSRVTKNPWDDKSTEDSSEISDVHWDGKGTARPYMKTTKPSWYNDVSTHKSTSHWENWKTSSTQRKTTATPKWGEERSSRAEGNSWTTSRPEGKSTRNYSISGRTMAQGNRIPKYPQRKPTKEPGWDGSTEKKTTTPLPGRKPVFGGSYYTTQSSSTTKRNPYGVSNQNSGRSGVSRESSTAWNSRTPISNPTTKSYGSVGTKRTWSNPNDSPSTRRPTARPLMPKSTQSSWQSTTNKYTTTTRMPNINLNMCGVRESLPRSRGRNARIVNDPDAVTLRPQRGSRNAGRSNGIFQRVVGGQEAEPFSWPWVAALYRVAASGGNRFLSAGSLINENYVLTAAHVFTPEDQRRRASYVVMLGTHTTKEAVAEYAVSSVLQHPEYQHRYYYYDIALLRLERPVAFNNYVMPVCLPSPSVPLLKDSDLVGKRATVMGWGDDSYGGITSRVLKEASFPIVSRQSCNASYVRVASNRFPRGITDDMLCAADPNGGKDACQGDSGGPLTTVENGRYTQVGIVSFGYKCGDKEYPGVYTKVASFLSWIAESTQNNDYDYYTG